MTTESNENNTKEPASNGGFWGKPLTARPAVRSSAYDKEIEYGFESDDETVANEPVASKDAAASFEPWASDSPALTPEEGEEGNVPSWLGLSHAMDDPARETVQELQPEPEPEPESDADTTSSLPLITQSDVVVHAPLDADESALDDIQPTTPAPAEPAQEAPMAELFGTMSAQPDALTQEAPEALEAAPSAQPSTFRRDEISHVPDLSWDDDLSQENENAFASADPYALDEPTDPSRYIDVSYGYGSDSEPYNANPDYLLNETAYDVGEAVDVSGKSTKIRVAIAIVAVVAVLGAVYAWGVHRYTNCFLPNSTVNGCAVGGMTQEEAVKALEQQTADYKLSVSVGDFAAEVAGADISLDRDEETMAAKSLANQSAYAWPLALVAPPNEQVEAGVSYDKDALTNVVTAAVDDYNEKVLPSDNAEVVFNEETNLYEVQGTTKGTAMDATSLATAVGQDVQAFDASSSPSEKSVTHAATVLDIPSLSHMVENVNRSRTTDIPILVNGETVITSTADYNYDFVRIDEGPEVVVNEEELRAWAEYAVAVSVFHSDDWSNYYLDIDAFVNEFSDRLKNGIVDGYEAPTYDELRTEGESRERAYAKGGWDSSLGRYIDVDLETQFARLFDENGNVIWESAFVSGEVYAGRSTVTGTFEIYSMETNTVLVGMDYDGDGQPDYESFVNYWMPFYGGYGLHDATWRANFGGEYYYYYGSHGCVNLPYSKAEELYNITHVGETVNVHW